MHNELLRIGSLTVHTYGLMIAIGIVVADTLLTKQAKKHGLDTKIIDGLILNVVIFGFVGAKVCYILTNIQGFFANPLNFIMNGWVVYGGIIGGLLSGILYCKKHGLDPKIYINLVFPEVALAQAFGRLGCLFAGCCYGKPTTSKFGLIFPEGSFAPAGVALFPTQIISSVGDFILFIILFKMYNSDKYQEDTGAWYLILYSIGRFMVEFLRGDTERGFVGNLSTSQFIAIFVLASGLIWLYFNKKARKAETVKE